MEKEGEFISPLRAYSGKSRLVCNDDWNIAGEKGEGNYGDLIEKEGRFFLCSSLEPFMVVPQDPIDILSNQASISTFHLNEN